jgi:hypothetical protein
MVGGTPGPLWIDQFEVKVAHDLGDDFRHFHQTDILSDTCSGSQPELGVRGKLDEGVVQQGNIGPCACNSRRRRAIVRG